ncbi:uncharacterized protein LOC100276891 precursor [Zea mays]|uniref:Tail-anchored protein insertion receptor WRB n=1 Tax=Zea mays TaxID=4577 RepID=B6TKP4_MAIZE|nr:uncharacterized protein LOC100276891 precursor [Zea mays]ACG37677.1 hypothetical protein [Zea mays]|eukprot:NP_001144064.1 uncharacterized protein LOC100276891 precursor [Zea mays]
MSLAAIFVFLLVSALQLLDRYLDLARKSGGLSDEQIKVRLEIKQLLKEADQLSTPSTFAQAAKLKRLAAAKEKELAKMQEHDLKGKQSLYDKYTKFLSVTKVIIYAVLVLCFWSTPVTAVPQHLLQPFGKMFSWRCVDTATGNVVVGILPWLFLTSRVSKMLCQKLGFVLVRP